MLGWDQDQDQNKTDTDTPLSLFFYMVLGDQTQVDTAQTEELSGDGASGSDGDGTDGKGAKGEGAGPHRSFEDDKTLVEEAWEQIWPGLVFIARVGEKANQYRGALGTLAGAVCVVGAVAQGYAPDMFKTPYGSTPAGPVGFY